jgi:rubrerythrin
MLEMALAALLVTVAIFAIGGRANSASQSAGPLILREKDEGIDLPCPWCNAQTREADDHCPSCGQRFG